MKSFPHLPILAAAAVALAASGCASPRTEEALAAKTPTEQFPFKVGEWADETLLAVHPQGGVSPNQAAALADAVTRWRDAGGDSVVVRTPVGNAQDGAAAAMAEQVRSVLLSRGVSYAVVRLERYETSGDPAAPLVVAFASYRAHVPECGKQWDNLTGTQSNNVHSNFGCAISANMAAQVANPRDLVQARTEDRSDAGRSAFQMDLYRRGQETASSAQAPGGSVSSAVK